MGIFRDQVSRLQRTRWGSNTQGLADELTAMFLTDDPITIDSGLNVASNNGAPPFNVTTNITENNTTVPPITVTIGGLTVPDIPLPPGTEPLATPSSGGAGNAFAGQVLGGSGTTYACKLYPGPIFKSVLLLNMSVDGTLPPGTWVMVVQIGATFVGFPPVFLGP
jgi:hypothetical protein